MGWGILSVILPLALAAVLVSAGIEDVRHREIANWKNAAIALSAPLWWWASGYQLWPDCAIQLGLALGVFALFALAFQLGQMGGGDVKLIGALALWFPFAALAHLLIAMSLIGGGLTLLFLGERWIRRKTEGQLEIPYGVAIVIAALLVLREPIFNHLT